MNKRTCFQCQVALPEGAHGSRKYCSDVCKSWAAWLGPGMSKHCGDCGEPMLASRTSKQAGGRCAKCSVHGHGGYKLGCRCGVCREAKNKTQRDFGRRRFEASGEWPRGRWIKTDDRAALYERDGWTCLICGLPTSREWSMGDPAAPTLDHIKPRSAGGTHDPLNLRTTHALCNAIRTDREDMPDKEVARLALARVAEPVA